jgi:hypothetical protein
MFRCWREPFPPALSTYPPLEEAQGSFEDFFRPSFLSLLVGFDRQPFLLILPSQNVKERMKILFI